jgi:hypothetical protein
MAAAHISELAEIMHGIILSSTVTTYYLRYSLYKEGTFETDTCQK